MSRNPYAPAVDDLDPALARGPGGGQQPWAVGEVLSIGWEAVKRSWAVLIFGTLIAGIIGAVPSYIPVILVAARIVVEGSAEYWVVYTVCTGISYAIQIFFQVGLVRIFLEAARGREPDFGLLLSGSDRYLPLLGMTLLMTLGVFGGTLLLIVPGIIFVLGVSLGMFYCVDAKLGPIEALKASWSATQGSKGQLFVYWLASIAVAFLGLLACCVGFYVAIPVIWAGYAVVYVRLSGNSEPPRAHVH